MREQERFGQARSGTFPGLFDFAHNSNDPGTTGYAFSNMYIGHVFNYQESLGRVPNNRYQTTWAFFAQDTWKVHRRVTLDIGLRFYKWTPPLNGGGEASAFTYERYDPTWGGKPPVLFQPTSTAQGRRALNPLNQQILPANFIGLIVPGTGYTCGEPDHAAESLQDQWHRDAERSDLPGRQGRLLRVAAAAMGSAPGYGVGRVRRRQDGHPRVDRRVPRRTGGSADRRRTGVQLHQVASSSPT